MLIQAAAWVGRRAAGGILVIALPLSAYAYQQSTAPTASQTAQQSPQSAKQQCEGKHCKVRDTIPLKPEPLPDAPQPQPHSQSKTQATLTGRATEFSRDIESAIVTQPLCSPQQMPCTLTPRQKFQLFVKRSYSPYTFLGAAFDSLYSHITDEKYGPGIGGWGQRYGATLADGESRSLFQTFLYSSLFHQDPRYHRLGTGNIFRRAAYAGSRVVVGRADGGGNAFNSPEMLGTLTTSAISNLYYPDRDQGVGRTFGRAVSGVGSDATTYMLREFWPDMKGWFHRHEPARVKRVEDKIPGNRPTATPPPDAPKP